VARVYNAGHPQSKIHAEMKFPFPFLLVLAIGWVGSGAWAEKADRDKPMQIEADNMQHDEHQQLTVFTGNVVATQGTLVLRAARMDIRQDGQGNQQAHLTAQAGARVFFRQKREGLDEFVEGEAEVADYDSKASLLVMTRQAEMRNLRGSQVADQVQGQKITYNSNTEVFTVDGKAPGTAGLRDQRVRAVLTPRGATPAPANAAPAAPLTGPALRSSPATSSKP
jgi:lipopolysaccharide export system protein LptA